MSAYLRRLPSLEDVKTEKAKRHLAEFARQAWPIVEPGTQYVHGWHIDAICEHLEAVSLGQILNLLINMPPRHMKSLLVSVFWPTWQWIRRPELRWLFASYAQTLSTRDSVKCRRLIESPWYGQRWGTVYQLTDDQNQKQRYENTRTGYRLATSVDGSATGEGGDIIVVDDPHNVREAESEAIRESTVAWWRESMSTRLNDPNTGARVVVMQRVHQSDVSGYILAEEADQWDHLCLPAEYEGKVIVTSIGWKDPRQKANELLWPERFDQKAMATLKRNLGSRAAAGQLQQRPAPAEGDLFKRVWWRFWKPAGVEYPPVSVLAANNEFILVPAVDLPASFDNVLQSWDMSFKDTDGSDFVAGGVWGKVGADKFLLDQVHERLSFTATLSAFQMLTAKWPQASLKLIEDKANGPAVINTLRQKIAGIVAVQPMGSKQARAAAVTPQVESGNVYLPHPHLAPWVWDYIEELASFPNGANDDQVDQTSQALIRLEQGGTVHTEAATATMEELAGIEAPAISPAVARNINPHLFPRARRSDPDD